jgi:hypothetical protein
MELYVGMDVSLKETSICVVDDNGEIVSEGTQCSLLRDKTVSQILLVRTGTSQNRLPRTRKTA